MLVKELIERLKDCRDERGYLQPIRDKLPGEGAGAQGESFGRGGSIRAFQSHGGRVEGQDPPASVHVRALRLRPCLPS